MFTVEGESSIHLVIAVEARVSLGHSSHKEGDSAVQVHNPEDQEHAHEHDRSSTAQ